MPVRRRTNQLSGVERCAFELGHFKELRSLFDWFFDSSLKHFDSGFEAAVSKPQAPVALGAAISRLQRLWEQLPRGFRGFESSHLEAPEALGKGISRLQRL